MVKTGQGWVLLSPLELLAVEAVGGATLAVGGVALAVVVGGAASALAVSGVASASAVDLFVSASVVGGGISSGDDGVRCPGSGVPGGRGCDVIRGFSDSGHMANGGGPIVGKVL
eukprot:g16819.t1